MSGGQWLENVILEAHGAGPGTGTSSDSNYGSWSDRTLDEQLAKLTAEKARREEAKRDERARLEKKERDRDEADIQRLRVRGFVVSSPKEDGFPLPEERKTPYDDGCRCHGRCVCEEAMK